MSEFFDAYICKCPHCKTKFASCEGPLCNCMDEHNTNKDENRKDIKTNTKKTTFDWICPKCKTQSWTYLTDTNIFVKTNCNNCNEEHLIKPID